MTFAAFAPIMGAAISGMMSSNDGGGRTQTIEMPGFGQDIGPMYADLLGNLAQTPHQTYDGQRIANLAPETLAGLDYLTQISTSANPMEQSASDMLSQTMAGAYINPMQNNNYLGATTGPAQANTAQANTAANPFIGQRTQSDIMGTAARYGNAAPSTASNQFIGAQTNVGTNPFAGSNPYLDQMINRNAQDMNRNWAQNTGTRLDAQKRASGSFGNTGLQQVEQESLNQLNRDIGNMASNVRMQDYGMQQGLAENDISRRMQAQMGDLGRNAGLQQGLSQFNAGMLDPLRFGQFAMNAAQSQAGLNAQDLGRNASLAQGLGQFNAGAQNNMGQFNAGAMNNNSQFNANLSANDLSRNAGLVENNMNRYMNSWNAERGRGMQAAGMFPQFTNAEQQRAQNLLGVGDVYRGYQQQLLNQNVADWQGAQQHPYDTLNMLGQGYNIMLGGAGTNSQTQLPDSLFSDMAGGAMIGQSLFGNSGNSQGFNGWDGGANTSNANINWDEWS